MLPDYIDAFSHYMKSGDLKQIEKFCVNPAQVKRLAVYRNGYYKACIEALAANYPTCEAILGERFRQIARAYVDYSPPVLGTLVGYGYDFPDFMTRLLNQESNTLGLPAIAADIARLDWAWLMSLISADSQHLLQAGQVHLLMEKNYDLSEINVRLNSSVQFCSVNSETLLIWVGIKTHQKTALHENSVSSAGTVMFWRIKDAVQARYLCSAESALVQTLQARGSSLGSAFQVALDLDPDFEVSEVFSACLQNELLEIDMSTYGFSEHPNYK